MNNKKRQEFRDSACLFLLFGIGFMLMMTQQSYYLSIDSDTILSRRFDWWGLSREDVIVDKGNVSDYHIARVEFRTRYIQHAWNVCANDQRQKHDIVLLTSRSCSVSKMAMNYISKNDSGWFWIPSGNIAVVLVGFGIFLIGVFMFFFDFMKRRDEATGPAQTSLSEKKPSYIITDPVDSRE